MCDTKKRGVFLCTVLSNDSLCDEHYRMTLEVDETSQPFASCSAGQFVQVQCRKPVQQAGAIVNEWPQDQPPHFSQPELLGNETLLRRPISLAGRKKVNGKTRLELIYRVVGVGTRWLSGCEIGDSVSIIGPLGNSMPLTSRPRAILVGGGVGIPPMIYMSQILHEAGKETVAFCGVRGENLLPLTAGYEQPSTKPVATLCFSEFSRHDTPVVIASDDGSIGFHGLVTRALEKYLDSCGWQPEEVTAYSCGPEPMMKALAELCRKRHIECYLSLERHMACGMGTCQSCIVKIKDSSKECGWSYKLCCTDGPVFRAQDVLW
ncbi:MAG TPA: dihydroorotate dehydrogenase electron transfer subunit [Phycisphaerae bacterium]|nr:dihydroorotate dehydrogenase electron transfer subunit [Phycisphaerae bacterium]